MASVLVVDDEPAICWAIRRALEKMGYSVATASSAEEGLEIARTDVPALVFLDVRLPKEDGLTSLPKFLDTTQGAPVVIMTAFGDLATAVLAVERGAADYVTKPFKLEDIEAACKAHLSRRADPEPTDQQRQRSAKNEDDGPDAVSRKQELVGCSAAMQSVFRQIAFFAKSELSVLITGETGTGKELVAAAIHRHSSRCDQPYLAVAPVAMNPDLIESELFGHVRGAFTGAESDRVGLFEAAEGGTILLDEIGDLPPALQAKLLRVLEAGEYCRVGEVAPRNCDVRVLAATSCDLQGAIADGRFREDLFYRINGMHIHLPPLRHRPDDFRPLCEYFLGEVDANQGGKIDEQLLAELAKRHWPGNIRELRNAVRHAAVLARGRAMQVQDFPVAATLGDHQDAGEDAAVEQFVWQWAKRYADESQDGGDLLGAFMAATEPALMKFAIESCGGNRARAAELLGIHRGTLRDRLRSYGIE